MDKAVFLDRDGVIIEEVNYLCNVEDIKIIEGIPESLAILKKNNFKLIVITNQPVIARGLATEEEVEKIHKEINFRIKQQSGVEIDKFYFCPHHPNADLEKYRISCNCRKPSPGFILQAVIDFDIDLSKSWMIGDRTSDIATGKNAGCKNVLIEKEYSKNKIQGIEYQDVQPDFVAENLNKAVKQIVYGN